MTEPQKPRRELFIWWTTSAESAAVGPVAPEKLPEYVRAQYADRYLFGHARTRLFVDKRFGEREITEWPDTLPSRMIKEGTSVGVVFVSSDIRAFKDVPGLVTDFKLRVVVI